MKRFAPMRRQVAETSPAAMAQELTTIVSDLHGGLHGNLALPVLGSRGEQLQDSNLKVTLRRVLFDMVDTDVALAHGLGRFPRHWMPVNPSDYCQFRPGTKSPDSNYLYLQCDTAGVVADFLIWAEAGGPLR